MAYRVTVSYAIAGEPPSERAMQELSSRLHAAAPDADARVALSAFALDVALTVGHARELDAIALAVKTADAVLGDAAMRATAQPA